MKVTSREEWGRILQLAASAYWMVPHGSTGMSPFLMLYGREALMPEEIPHVNYASKNSYEIAVEKYIEKMLAIHQEALKKNQISVQRSKEYFDRKFVKKSQLHNFVVGDIVLMNVKKRIKDIKIVGV